MSNFVKVAEIEDLESNEGTLVEVSGKHIAIFKFPGNKLYAVDDKCPHRGAPLSEGVLHGESVRCPWHGARFDVCTGKALTPPAYKDLQCYNVQLREDGVYLDPNPKK